MIILNIIHNLLWWFVLGVLYFAFTISILPVSYFLKNRQEIFFRAARLWARIMVWFSFIPVKISGQKNCPVDGPLIIISNHQSMLDIFLLLAFVPRYFRFVVKKELFKVPFMSWYMRQVGFLSIDRQAAMKAHRTLEEIKTVLQHNEAVVIFPEGTRSPDGVLKEFKRGVFDLALTTGSPILPVGINGTYKIVPKGEIIFRPVPVTMKFGTVIQVAKNQEPSRKDYQDLISRVHAEIATLQ